MGYVDGIVNEGIQQDCKFLGETTINTFNFANLNIGVTTNIGVIFYIYDFNGDFVTQIFINRNNNERIVNLTLLPSQTYHLVVSTFYTSNIYLIQEETNCVNEINKNYLTFVTSENTNVIGLLINVFNNLFGLVSEPIDEAKMLIIESKISTRLTWFLSTISVI